ncbi:MAG: ABC transporter ATP-binding protein [Dehalococcoidia bacterium]|nr:ABC transporter ATP-binding protein [Dehalococcoidia bacterium]
MLPRPCRLCAVDATLAYDRCVVAERLSVEVPDGAITAIVGPNACGKSTLLRALARLLKPSAGGSFLDGEPLHRARRRALAQCLGLLPQAPVAPVDVTVADLVAGGRTPHQRWYRQWSAEDERAVEAALATTHTADLRHRTTDALSGGQRQRAFLGMALARQTPIMLLDEPTTFLDIAHQVEVLDLVRALNRDEGRTVVMVLHDLSQACRYADHLVVMHQGRVVATGSPREVVTPALVRDVFGVEAAVVTDARTGRPLVLPYSLEDLRGVGRG